MYNAVLVCCAIINVCLNCEFFNYRDDANVDDHEYVNHQASLAQKLNLELGQKQKIFSKNDIYLSKVVGQGLYNSTYIHSPKKTFDIYYCLCRGVWISILWLP